jgi:uncharacterized membrane protein YjjP (DUF1212 family)
MRIYWTTASIPGIETMDARERRRILGSIFRERVPFWKTLSTILPLVVAVLVAILVLDGDGGFLPGIVLASLVGAAATFVQQQMICSLVAPYVAAAVEARKVSGRILTT